MKKSILFLAVLLVLAFAESKVLAVIGTDNVITEESLDLRIKSLPAQYAEYFAKEDGRLKLLDQMIDEKVVYLKAKADNYDKKPDVQKALALANEEVIISYYLKDETAKVDVDKAEVDKYYQENKAQFASPEAVKASHILVKTEDEAKALLKEIQSGKDFAEVAKAKSTCPSAPKGGDLGFFTKGQMVASFENEAFALKPGEMSKAPIQTQFGWHIIKATDYTSAKEKPLSEVEPQIKEELLQTKKREIMNNLIEQAKKEFKVEKKI